MADGMGCMCQAHDWSECGCLGVDWTPQEVYDLRKVYLAAKAEIENPAWAGICDESVLLERAVREYERKRGN